MVKILLEYRFYEGKNVCFVYGWNLVFKIVIYKEYL